jgi:uncharacterized protein (TIGR03083 family)
MSDRAIEALGAERHEVLRLARTLTEAEWNAPSDCAGWRVQDVVAHLANTFRMAVDPGSLPEAVPGDIEATQAVYAEAHREWSPAEVVADYQDMASKAIGMCASFQRPEFADARFPMDNAGHYPLHLLPDAFTFDHFCHLRNDILRPHGPVDRPVPAPDELRVGVTVAWMLVGLPQMSGVPLQRVAVAPIGLRLTGPGGGEWTFHPGQADGLVTVAEGLLDGVKATVTSSALDFVSWGTRRRPWQDSVRVEGDEALASGILDAIHVF